MTNPVNKTLGRRIRDLRKAKGLTQRDLASSCAVHWTYIGGLERGERNPTMTTLTRVAGGLGVGVAQLINPRLFPKTDARHAGQEARLLRMARKTGSATTDLAARVLREVIRWQDRYTVKKQKP